MTISDVAALRLHNQGLTKHLSDPVEVLRHLGAVQAQDFTGAKWALGLRCDTTDEEVSRLFNDGKILRTHMLRPTWHFVAPEDLRWMQQLTAPRVHATIRHYDKKNNIDEPTTKKANATLVQALKGGNHLTRTEIAKLFEAAGIQDAKGQRLTHLMINAELDAVICSGALRGKQHTYALFDERVPKSKPMPRDTALAELVRRFFTSHGPAQIQDLAWWSSLTVADVKKGIGLAKLKSAEVDGKTYYSAHNTSAPTPTPTAHLLPNYDEYFIAYKDRAAFSEHRSFKVTRNPTYEDVFYHLIALDGQLAGGWKRDIKPKEFIVKLNMFTKLTPEHQKALQASAARLQAFAGLPVKLA